MAATNLTSEFANKMLELVGTPGHAYVQIRKFFNGLDWDIPYENFQDFDMDPKLLCYAGWDSKYKQLDRNYWNQVEFDKSRDQFLKRIKKDQTCVTARFGNQEKGKDSMGFCMQTISMNHIRKPVEGQPNFIIEVNYRSTECMKKFAADLRYLSDKVIPYLIQDLPIKPDLIRLRFCTMYISSMFLPILMNLIDPVKVIETIKNGDNYWYDRTVSCSLGRWLEDENPYNWQTQAIQWDNFNNNVKPRLTRPQLRKLRGMSRKPRR